MAKKTPTYTSLPTVSGTKATTKGSKQISKPGKAEAARSMVMAPGMPSIPAVRSEMRKTVQQKSADQCHGADCTTHEPNASPQRREAAKKL